MSSTQATIREFMGRMQREFVTQVNTIVELTSETYDVFSDVTDACDISIFEHLPDRDSVRKIDEMTDGVINAMDEVLPEPNVHAVNAFLDETGIAKLSFIVNDTAVQTSAEEQEFIRRVTEWMPPGPTRFVRIKELIADVIDQCTYCGDEIYIAVDSADGDYDPVRSRETHDSARHASDACRVAQTHANELLSALNELESIMPNVMKYRDALVEQVKKA